MLTLPPAQHPQVVVTEPKTDNCRTPDEEMVDSEEVKTLKVLSEKS